MLINDDNKRNYSTFSWSALGMTIGEVEVITTRISHRFAVTGVLMVQNLLYTKLKGFFLLIYLNIIFKLKNLMTIYLKVIFFYHSRSYKVILLNNLKSVWTL